MRQMVYYTKLQSLFELETYRYHTFTNTQYSEIHTKITQVFP